MHIRSPNWRALDCTNVSFITRLSRYTGVRRRYFVKCVDSTRRIVAPTPLCVPTSLPPFWIRHYHFSQNALSMYHMNLVRRDGLYSKLKNSSTNNENFFKNLERAFSEWVPGEPFYFPGKGVLQVEYVENEFGTWSPEEM